MSIFRFTACCLSLAFAITESYAQTASPSTSTQTTTTSTQTSKVVEVRTLAPDLLMMSSGSVLVIRGKQRSRLDTEIRLADDSILTPGGTVRRPDGSSTMLSDGQAISAAGKISAAPAQVLTETTSTSVEVVPAAKP